MILLLAIVAGLLAGLVWAGMRKVRYETPVLRHIWLVFVAFLPQYIVTYLPVRENLPIRISGLCLIVSQLLLFVFAMLNRNHQGMKILMIGTMLNFLVMAANGGFMPISPQTASRLVAPDFLSTVLPGSRFGPKDILLSPGHIHFEWLADRFLPPLWSSYQVAFSLGDIFIAAGVFWLLARQKNIYIRKGYNS
jgi:hypothetical protein